MTKKLWQALFSIEILDKSKKTNEVIDMAVLPTALSLQKMKQLGLSLKKLNNGIVLIYETDGTNHPFKNTGLESFAFYLKSNNRLLDTKLKVEKNIFDTNSPFKVSGTGIFYFDNVDKDGKILRGDGTNVQTLFQKQDTLTDDDKALAIGNDSAIFFNKDLKIKLLQRAIEDRVEKELGSVEGTKDKNKPLNMQKIAKDTLTNDYINLPDALYRLSWGTTLSEQMNVFKSDDMMSEKPFGIVEIFENKDMPLNRTIRYTLEIERKSTWFYLILQNTTLPISHTLEVKSGSTIFNFKTFSDASLDTMEGRLLKRFQDKYNSKATLYSSQSPILIDRKTAIYTTLKGTNNGVSFENRLATPTADTSDVVIIHKIE